MTKKPQNASLQQMAWLQGALMNNSKRLGIATLIALVTVLAMVSAAAASAVWGG